MSSTNERNLERLIQGYIRHHRSTSVVDAVLIPIEGIKRCLKWASESGYIQFTEAPQPFTFNGTEIFLTESQFQEIVTAIRANRKIRAIKIVRHESQIDLREAKAWVEDLQYVLNLSDTAPAFEETTNTDTYFSTSTDTDF